MGEHGTCAGAARGRGRVARAVRLAVVAGALVAGAVVAVGWAGPAVAQTPSRPEARQADRAAAAACRADLQRLCPGLQGAEARRCLSENLAALDPDCQAAIGAAPQGQAASAAVPIPEGQRVLDDVVEGVDREIIALFGGKTYPVKVLQGALIDKSRDREIAYLWRFPEGFTGKAPLIITSHGGYGSTRGLYAYPHLGTTYAKLGFVVLSINHLPSANEEAHRFDRPTDVTYVINALVKATWPDGGGPEALAPPAGFAGQIDVTRIGHVGHSFGGYTANLLGGARVAPTLGVSSFRDPRIDAIVPISPQGGDRFGFWNESETNHSWTEVNIPVYTLFGERENPPWRRQPFDRYPAIGDKFATMGAGQDHGGMGGQGGDEVRRLLALNTALFFHTYLRADRPADTRCRIGTLAWLPGWTLERKLDPALGQPCG